MELLFEREIDVYLRYFDLTKKKFFFRRLKVLFLVLALYTVLVYVFKDNIWFYLAYPLVALIAYKLPYYELLKIVSRENIIKEQMFPTFLRYFISLVSTQGNVYRTLRAIVPYMEEPLRAELIELIKKLDSKDVEDYDAFIEFADFIGSSEAHMIMSIINQFNEEGINRDELNELEDTIKELQENKMNEAIEYKVNSLDKHANPILVYAITYTILFTITLFVAYFKDLPL